MKFVVSCRVSVIDFRLVSKYESQLIKHLEDKLILPQVLPYETICFFFDVHPKMDEDYKPLISRSKKMKVLTFSMNCYVEDFMAADQKGEGLDFLKVYLEEGIKYHQMALLKEGILNKH